MRSKVVVLPPGGSQLRWVCREFRAGEFAPGCTMNFSMVECLFWLASVPNRPTAISWPRSSTRCRQLGRASARCRPAGADARLYDRRCRARTARRAEGRLERHAAPTSSASARASPKRCRASPKASRHGARSWRPRSAAPASRPAGQPGPDDALVSELALARQTETRAQWLTRDLRTLTQLLSRDVLTLAGPDVALYLNGLLLNLRASFRGLRRSRC